MASFKWTLLQSSNFWRRVTGLCTPVLVAAAVSLLMSAIEIREGRKCFLRTSNVSSWVHRTGFIPDNLLSVCSSNSEPRASKYQAMFTARVSTPATRHVARHRVFSFAENATRHDAVAQRDKFTSSHWPLCNIVALRIVVTFGVNAPESWTGSYSTWVKIIL